MEVTGKELRDLVTKQEDHGFRVGQRLFMRTVTYHITGEVVSIDGNYLTLKDAAWIADSGRFSDAIKSGKYAEVEPLPDGWRVNHTTITDCGPINSLPRTQC